jgi:hypothetical protein
VSIKQEAKREKVAQHNHAFDNEKLNLSGLPSQERQDKLVLGCIKSVLNDLKPQINEFLGKKGVSE